VIINKDVVDYQKPPMTIHAKRLTENTA